MKKLFVLLIMLFVSMSITAQHRYLVTVKGVYSQDSVKFVCEAFKELRATKCEYSTINHYFKIETKTFLPSVIVEDYFSAQGYYVTMFMEVEEKPILFTIPSRKDSDKIKTQ